MLALHRHRVADGAIGRAGRAPRRAAAHPLRRERRGRRVLPGDVRLPADGVPRAHRLARRPDLAGPLRAAEPGRGDPARAGRRRRRPLPVEQPHPRVGDRAGRRVAPGGRRGRPRRRRVVVGGLRHRCGWRRARPCCSPSCTTARRPARPGWRSRWPPSEGPPASAAAASSACSRRGRWATSRCGRSRGRRSPARSPTRSRRGCAADRSPRGTPSCTDASSSTTARSSTATLEDRLVAHRREAARIQSGCWRLHVRSTLRNCRPTDQSRTVRASNT